MGNILTSGFENEMRDDIIVAKYTHYGSTTVHV